jgi:putative spermidine/putrescine transport system substrate-binding protein
MDLKWWGAVGATIALSAALTGCGDDSDSGADASSTDTTSAAAPSGDTSSSSAPANEGDWAKAQSADDGGGMDALVAAAQAEGTLNVIALPPDWANYAAIIDAFKAKYGIKVNSENPDGSSSDEITALKSTVGQSSAPDVVDVGNSYALQGAIDGLFAPYQVATWGDVPDEQKDEGGLWVSDYGGYISIGCNAKTVKTCPTTIADLDNPDYKGLVALNGDPTQSNSAFQAVWALALANGGSADDIQPGIDFVKKLNGEGIFNKTEVTPATIASGATPIVLDWDYLNAGETDALAKEGVDWQVSDPSDGLVSAYYSQAISLNAPHPAAARLWEEFLYSHDADGGQNGWLRGYARPIELDAMTADGTADADAVSKIPQVDAGATPFVPTQDQVTAAQQVVAKNWSAAVS